MRPRVVAAASASRLVEAALSYLAEDCNGNAGGARGCGGEGGWEPVAPRGMPTRESRNVAYQLTDVSRCAAWLPGRGLNYPFMAAEFLWMFCGRGDVASIAHYNDHVAQFSDDGASFYGAYGPRWRAQVWGAAHRLRADPTSRQAVACTWRPEYNLPSLRGGEPAYAGTRDVPCTLTMQYQLRAGRLESTVSMRSSDAFLGLPYDVFNFAMLQRAVAAELGAGDGPLTVLAGSSHLYERDLERARACAGAPAEELREVALPAPPGLDSGWVSGAEAHVRAGADPDDLNGLGSAGWRPMLSLLGHRRHRDHRRVLEPYRSLVRP